jgi:cytochrome b subunit of formate dehydrogenase
MLNLLITIVVTLLIVGVFLWAIDAMPWINADIKRLIHILIVVVAVLWVIHLLFPRIAHAACKDGYVKTDVEGVCMAQPVTKTNPEWVSDEKPPTDKMPSWQREGIHVVEAPNMAYEDAKMDQERRDADAAGKKAAGITGKRKK